MAVSPDKSEILVQLVRLGMSGRPQDVQAFARKIIRTFHSTDASLVAKLVSLLSQNPTHTSPLREVGAGMMPVDADSRLNLAKHEFPVLLDIDPILPVHVSSLTEQIVQERRTIQRLVANGMEPSSSLLLVGPPGVGKTLTVRWLAKTLGWPLLTLELTSVMSSFLGKTGNNLRGVLDFAKQAPCILLLDEFDAIAKRRDEFSEIGELKRLVTVLLQEIDDWPSTSILAAATNHPELLDSAVWRRFDIILEFPLPDHDAINKSIPLFFGDLFPISDKFLKIMAKAWDRASLSDISRSINRIKRKAVVGNLPLESAIVEELGAQLNQFDKGAKLAVVGQFIQEGHLSQREASRMTGISRDTLRRYANANS